MFVAKHIMDRHFVLLVALGLLFLAAGNAGATTVEDLPLLDPEVSVYQVSSHNKKGLNGDGGWYLHDGEAESETLAGWSTVDDGASAAYSKDRQHEGEGALVHTVELEGRESGWRSIRKELTGGFNFAEYDRLSMYVWPTHADGGLDYAVRIDSGGATTQLDIRDLEPGQWNQVVLDLSDIPREGVEAFWLLFNLDWGAADGMTFFVDDIRFLQEDGQGGGGGKSFTIDDFETGRRRAVLFDAVGPGTIRQIWGLGGHDLRIEVDGEVIVDGAQDDFFQGRIPGFPLPLVNKELVASGPWRCITHWSFVPIGFRERCRITTSHPTPFYHVIAERYRDASQVEPWREDQDLSTLKRAFATPPGEDPKGWTGLRQEQGTLDLAPGESAELASLNGAGAIASLRIALPQAKDAANSLWVCMDWDGMENQVEAPLGFFFGAGVRWQDIPSLVFGINGDEGYSHFPMPFWKSARIRIENRGSEPAEQIGYEVSWRPEAYPEDQAGYFRADFREGETTRGEDWLLLKARGQGHLVGVVQRLIGGHYCEGDIRFHIDGSRSPALYGTGSEDYYHQACWPNKDNHTPFHGCVGDVALDAEQTEDKGFHDFPACYYRVHLEAPVRFRSAIRAGIEHGGHNNTDSDYASLAFWYGRDRVGLVQTDAVAFSGPGLESLTGFFEGDDDEVAVTCDLLKTAEPITCTLAIDPANAGVRLRRVLDQSIGPQRAEIFVDGEPAGTWYSPDRNPWKRLAESDFELPLSLVRGKSSIRVTFRPQKGAWSIGQLRAFSLVDKP